MRRAVSSEVAGGWDFPLLGWPRLCFSTAGDEPSPSEAQHCLYSKLTGANGPFTDTWNTQEAGSGAVRRRTFGGDDETEAGSSVR